MNNAFPLLDLPPNVLRNALRIMATLDIISFSFISIRTKSLVVPLNLNFRNMHITVNDSFEVEIGIFHFKLCRESSNGPVPLTIADTVQVRYLNQVYNWRKEGYGVRDWIDHLMAVTNQSKISRIEFQSSDVFRVDSIKATLQGLDVEILCLFHEFSLPYLLDVVAAFPLKKLHVYDVYGPSIVELHSVLAQNFDALEVLYTSDLSVNELVIMNTEFLEVHFDELVQLKMFNSFLKLWKTGCNRRLEYVFLYLPETNIDETANVILKGIKHQVIPQTIVRRFKRPVGVDVPEAMVEVAGGFDVQGIDGRSATIRVTNDFCQMFFSFE